MVIANIASYIDHTLLKPNTTIEQIARLCREAREHKFASICVNPCHTYFCQKEFLHGTDIKTCTVIGFPLGANHPDIKLIEVERAINDGASELDIVINIGYLLSSRLDLVHYEICRLVELAHSKRVPVKVIIETGLLTDPQKIQACKLVVAAGADFVKTCTGFNGGQATVEDIKLIKSVVGDSVRIKAAGGIKSYTDALALIEAGADRLGTSSGVKIVEEEAAALKKE